MTSRDQLTHSDKNLKVAKANLEVITAAEKTLNNHQAEGRARAHGPDRTAPKHLGGAEYLRSKAKSVVSQAQSVLAGESSGGAKPADPYGPQAALAEVENLRTQAESTIDYDHRCFTAARSAINSADSADRAESAANSVASREPSQ